MIRLKALNEWEGYLMASIIRLIIAAGVIFALPNGTAMTLEESFQESLLYTARIKEKLIEEKIAQKEKAQSLSTLLPSLSATSDHLWRDRADVGAFGQGYQKTSYLTLSQPLFQGGAEYSAYKIAQSLPEIAQLKTQQEKINLYGEVAQLFYEVLRIERELKTYVVQSKILQSRVDKLSKRARIGRSRSTEVLAARTQLARVVGSQAQAQSQLQVVRQSYQKLTGVAPKIKLLDTKSIETLKVPTRWEEQLIHSPQVRIAELMLEKTKKEVGVSRAEYFPKVNLDSNYYLDRSGILVESKWDVTIQAKWNIFNGTYDYSEKKKKDLEMRNLENYLVEQKNHLKGDFRSLRVEFLSRIEVLQKLKTAKDLSEMNYKQHVKEARQGLVSQLEVLRVLEESLQAKQLYDRQEFSVKIAWVQLQVLAGVMP